MKKKKRGCLIGTLIFIGFCITVINAAMNTDNKDVIPISDTKEVIPIFSANEYSGISSNELLGKMGEPNAKDDWINKNTKGEFPVTTYEYDIDGVHYEFIVADDKVVRVSIYSNQDWNNQGDLFTYARKLDMLHLFGIREINDAAKIADSDFSYRIRPVSDKIQDFWIPEMDSKNKTFGFVKITYNLQYFD